MSKQALRNVLRWGGIGVAVIGLIVGRTTTNPHTFAVGRMLVWAGLVMVVAAIFLRLFISEP